MTSRMPRLAWCGLSCGCIGLGAIGLVLPLLPTTPFLLVAAWAATKGSPRLAYWLWQHPRLGPPLQAWQLEGAVPRRAKHLAVALLLLSWTLLWLGGAPAWGLATAALLFGSVAAFVLTRPDAARQSGAIAATAGDRMSRP
ncbi:DUF454 domain-containing protein [Billgrantia azerbaijanica]|nr:DUF454 domain-containing protein [Halomonas azerbaijanica]